MVRKWRQVLILSAWMCVISRQYIHCCVCSPCTEPALCYPADVHIHSFIPLNINTMNVCKGTLFKDTNFCFCLPTWDTAPHGWRLWRIRRPYLVSLAVPLFSKWKQILFCHTFGCFYLVVMDYWRFRLVKLRDCGICLGACGCPVEKGTS